jgi:hypothetical protein
MAGRPQIKQADLTAIARLNKSLNKGVVDLRPVLAYVMRYCGCSYEEIGMAFGVSRQMGKTLVESAEKQL